MNETPTGVNLLEAPAPPPAQDALPNFGPEAARAGARRGFFAWLRRALPTFLVLLAIGGVGAWGHHTGWKLPKFAELFGGAEPRDDWCKEHSVPESVCVECNKALLPKPPHYGWCKAHGVHDCPFEHPDVAQLNEPPRVSREAVQRAERALQFAQRKANKSKCPLHPRRLQVKDQDTLTKLGIEPGTADESPVEESVAASGEVTYDPSLVANLAAPVPGRVWLVEEAGNLGRRVQKDEVLALVDAAEVGKAKAEFLRALADMDPKARTVARLKPLVGGGVSVADFQNAEAALRQAQLALVAAEQALLNLGLPIRAEDVKGLAPGEVGRRIQFLGLPDAYARRLARTTTANLIPVKASFAGVVVARHAVQGQLADPSKPLFVVADPGRMWLTLHLPQDSLKPFREKDLTALLGGKAVRFVPDGTDEEVTGKVTWISTAVDERTRTLQVRAELPNPDGRLRANTFGSGRVVLRTEARALVVPTEAVHWEGSCHVVFVWDKNFSKKGAPKVFHVRTVVPGVRNGPSTEIIAGLLRDEMVATRNSGVLRSELLKNNLGEG
jgi:membrane fusion protein, heavy metal efflux system